MTAKAKKLSLARGMTVQSSNGRHYAFCVRCKWRSSKQQFGFARMIASQPCPECNPMEDESA